jgi:hypothetical protein
MVKREESLASAFASDAANPAAAVACAILTASGALQFCEHLTVSFDSPGPPLERVAIVLHCLIRLQIRLGAYGNSDFEFLVNSNSYLRVTHD